MIDEEVITNDINLALISLTVSIVGTILIPIIYSLVKKFILWVELKSFEKLINEDYIKKVDQLIEKYGYDSDVTLNDEINIKLKRLGSLKSEELIYLNSTNQFKMIRLVELVRSYFTNINDITEIYFFRQPYLTDEDGVKESIKYEKSVKIKKKALLTLKKAFEDNKSDYIRLKKDHLLNDSDEYIRDIKYKIMNVTAD